MSGPAGRRLRAIDERFNGRAGGAGDVGRVAGARARRSVKEKRLLAGLLHQQCWCWGHDVRRPAGNLLLAAGLSRHRPPPGVVGSSRYEAVLPGGVRLGLWGFGLHVAPPATPPAALSAGVLMGRFDPGPWLVPGGWNPDGAHSPDALPPGGQRRRVVSADDRAAARRLLPAACRWVAAHETFVDSVAGPAYRAGCLASWEKVAVEAAEMSRAWLGLARRFEQFYDPRPSAGLPYGRSQAAPS